MTRFDLATLLIVIDIILVNVGFHHAAPPSVQIRTRTKIISLVS